MDLSLNINSYRNGLIIALLHNGLQVAVSFLSIVNSCIIQKVLLFYDLHFSLFYPKTHKCIMFSA
jgi:hypothetical protein